MSKVTEKEVQILKDEIGSEGYHSAFDALLEDKLSELDPEWMKEMQQLYTDSGCSRWCA